MRGIKTDLKTKKTVMPMTTPRPAIPREKVIQHEDRDSGILPLEFNKKYKSEAQNLKLSG